MIRVTSTPGADAAVAGHAARLLFLGLLLLTAGAALAQPPAAASGAAGDAACVPQPLGKRDLYLRGTFNNWAASDAHRFRYVCNRFELVTSIDGSQSFKVADEDWSADADFGAAAPGAGPPWRLAAKGKGIEYRFGGNHRLVLNMTSTLPATPPTLGIESCPAAPSGASVLYLRGSMNNWTSSEDFAFRYHCDAYYLNVRLQGRHEFRIADATWNAATTFGAAADASARLTDAGSHTLSSGGAANLQALFTGEHTLRLTLDQARPVLRIGPKTFVDATEPAVTDPLALRVRFDSRNLACKKPFGATRAGTIVEFSVAAPVGVSGVTLVVEKRLLEGNQERLEYNEVARIALVRNADGDGEHWRGRHRFADVSVYGYYFEVTIGNQRFVYQNNRDAVYWTREKGSNGVGLIDEIPVARKSIRRFRHTVHHADFKVPAWARDAIYYYIFPDRFRNGNPANDPNPATDTHHGKPVEFHRNWIDRPFKPGSGDGSDQSYNNDFFGGDLAGIIDKLDYIAKLGANTLYLTPVFRAASNHKYDTADYRNIDPSFGTNADFTRLTAEAARRGMRVIPDTSLNHTGSDSIYFDRFSRHRSRGAFEGGRIRADSPYAGWYRFDASQSDPDKQYKGWIDVSDLPELDKSSRDFRQFAFGAPDSVMKLWLDRGAAGWRMDVAPWVPDDFWREWRNAIKRHKPDALTIAETWFDASKYFLGDTFDSTMNYIFRNTVLDYAKGGDAASLYRNLELLREVYPPQALYALMNLLSSHDVARSLHVLGDEGEHTAAAKAVDAKQRLRLAIFFQMTYPGAPAIYYGDEVGVTGGDDPYNRAPYPWEDRGGKPDTALLADVTRMVRLRRDHAVLRHGTIDAPLLADRNVIVLARRLNNTWAITATNNATEPKTVRVSLPADARFSRLTDALDGSEVEVLDRSITLTIPAMFGRVLTSR